MQGRAIDWDPFVISPQFGTPATAWQVIEVRLRTGLSGAGETFWTNTTRTQYGGLSPGKSTRIGAIGDGEWHTYRLRPRWHAEQRIILLCLDPPRATPDAPADFAVDFVRIADPREPGQVGTEPRWDFSGDSSGWSTTADLTAVPSADALRVYRRPS